MLNPAALLSAYDAQLRTDAETPSAVSVVRLGPLRLVTFAGGRGFVTYRDLDGADAATIARLVPLALDHYRDDPGIERVEWKTRGHDHAPGLHDALLANGFEPDEPESIMVGEARLLAVEVRLPDGVTLRLRRDLGRRYPAGVARTRDLPGANRRAGTVGTAKGQDLDPQRLDRVFASHPRTLRARQGLDHDPVQLAPQR